MTTTELLSLMRLLSAMESAMLASKIVFTVKEGQTDLKQYVYDAAEALVRAARAPAEDLCGWSYRLGIADAEAHYGIKGDQHGESV